MSNRRLLLADDSVTIRKVVELTFADEGIDVITVADGDAAVERIEAERPDVVLADVHMPGLTGYQVCELIRSHDDTKDIPVVLLVGSFEPFDEAEAARVGADGHLTKPFQSIRILVEKVSELMERSSRTSGDVDLEEEAESADKSAEHETEQPDLRSEQKSQVRGVDTEDIDNLYTASFAETIRMPEADETDTLEFVDAGMDDEMIETSYASDPVAGNKNGHGPTSDSDNQSESAAEPDEDVAVMETVHLHEPLAARQSPFDSIADANAGSSIDDSELFSGLETLPGEKEMTAEDLDLLEIPPAGTADSIPKLTVETRSSQIVSISPELLELIVQKVVERLSEKD